MKNSVRIAGIIGLYAPIGILMCLNYGVVSRGTYTHHAEWLGYAIALCWFIASTANKIAMVFNKLMLSTSISSIAFFVMMLLYSEVCVEQTGDSTVYTKWAVPVFITSTAMIVWIDFLALLRKVPETT
ncbi:MAG: hypothetical protein NUV54_00395 [Candidatus Taylorbacteria bacterium]|nr:hypothetical protein [Candidatus Taylorbacteria bacterium]